MGAILGNTPSALGTIVGTRQFERREFESEHSHFHEIIRNQGHEVQGEAYHLRLILGLDYRYLLESRWTVSSNKRAAHKLVHEKRQVASNCQKT